MHIGYAFSIKDQVKQVESYLMKEVQILWICIQSPTLGKNILQCKWLESISLIDSFI